MIRNFYFLLLIVFTSLSVSAQVMVSSTHLLKASLLEDQTLVQTDVRNIEITDQHYDVSSNLQYYYLRQQFNGLPIFNAVASAALRETDVVSLKHTFVPNLVKRPGTVRFTISGKQALNAVLADVGMPENRREEDKKEDNSNVFTIVDSELSNYPVTVERGYTYFQKEIKAVWFVKWVTKDEAHNWYVQVDANTGEVLTKHDLVLNCQFGDHSSPACNHTPVAKIQQAESVHKIQADASYEVFPMPVESPNHGNRKVVEDPADSTASPFGWHDTNGVDGAEFTITRGNNVFARDDIDGNNFGGTSPDGGASLNFTADYDINQSADNYLDAAIINLFYWNNIMHDVWYHYGFDEVAGNFQQNNYGKGGQGFDYVNADAQDGSGTNNANFNPLPEGNNPRMQMYLWAQGLSSDLFEVLSPTSIAGKYGAVQSGFGPRLTLTPITGDLVLVNDGSGNASSGCNTLVNGAEIDGNIAVIDRGGCNFDNKVANAQNAGARAVIMINNVGTDPIVMGGDDPNITIPQVMISLADGNTLKNRMALETVRGSLYDSSNAGVFFYDSDFDNGVIAHEYTHGISTRLTGGSANSTCLINTEQMGEGWSDFLSLVMTHEPGDEGSDKRGIGTYVRNQSTTGRGIRPYPYSTDKTINPVTYDYIKLNSFTRPHGVGSAWCTMLWDLYWAFIDEYGYDSDIYKGTGGNNMVMHLVMDGLKLQPCSPGFVDGRDAILKADELRYGNANQALIWKVFANRGLGYSADQGSTNSKTDGTQAFDLPPSFGKYIVEKTTVDIAYSGDTITYQIKVKNTGAELLDEITVMDSLGNGAVFFEEEGNCSLSLSNTSQVFIWKVNNLKAGDSVVCSYTVILDTNLGGSLLWSDDVETDTMGWLAISDLGGGQWTRTTTSSSSGTNSWFIDNVGFQSDRWIQNTFDLTTSEKPTLTFKHKFETEDTWDGAVVEVNDNGTWVDLGANMVLGGYNAIIENNPASRIRNRPAFTGKVEDFMLTTIDLEPYIGDSVDIRFRFVSDGLQGSVGWFIDDIELWEEYTVLENKLVGEVVDLPAQESKTSTSVIWKSQPIDTSGSDTVIIVIPGDTSKVTDELVVYPNPVEDDLTVSFTSKLIRSVDLTLYDAIGRKLWVGEVVSNSKILVPMQFMAGGIYILETVDGDNRQFFKLLHE